MRNTQWTGVIKMTFYEWSLRYGRRCQIFSIVTNILMFVFSEIKNNLIFFLCLYVLYVCNTHFFLSLSFSMYSMYVTYIFFFLFLSLCTLCMYRTHIFFSLSLFLFMRAHNNDNNNMFFFVFFILGKSQQQQHF